LVMQAETRATAIKQDARAIVQEWIDAMEGHVA
jgi:hypothetical protein